VAQIAQGYDLQHHYVAVVGDLNSANGDHSLDALLTHPDLHNVVLDLPAAQRWTYDGNQREQIDYVLTSSALTALPRQVTIERRGLFSPGCAAGGTCYPEVKSANTAASDHAGLVVELTLPL
jgi:endonuclease/exonuclease/phosphatase family metal-dependent hydrolase